MNTHSKTSSILASVIAMILAVPGGAWADEGRYDNGGQGNGYQKKGHYNTPITTAITIIITMVITRVAGTIIHTIIPIIIRATRAAGIITITTTIITTTTNCGSACWAVASSVMPSAITSRATPMSRVTTRKPAPPPPQTVTQYETVYPGNTCLQQREYRSKIMVGGRQVDGYGTACLQPDGSWRYGPAQAAY